MHVTLNTGHTMPIPDNKHAASIEMIESLYPNGGSIPGLPAFRVDFGGGEGAVSFCIWRGREPLAINIVCWSQDQADESWNGLVGVIDKEFAIPLPGKQPEQTPWLATLLLPQAAMQTQDDLSWFGDFEQCIAVMLLKKIEGKDWPGVTLK